jgi:hypothetical protein
MVKGSMDCFPNDEVLTLAENPSFTAVDLRFDAVEAH